MDVQAVVVGLGCLATAATFPRVLDPEGGHLAARLSPPRTTSCFLNPVTVD